MMNLKIVIYGSVSEATDFAASFESKHIKTFLNTVPNEVIDILIVFNEINKEILPFISNNSIIFLFDSSFSFGIHEAILSPRRKSLLLTPKHQLSILSLLLIAQVQCPLR